MNKSILKRAALNNKEDILAPYDVIIDMDGFEAVCAFSELLGGNTYYVPNVKKIFQRCLEKEAINEFDGGNYIILARKYGFSESHLRKLFRH